MTDVIEAEKPTTAIATIVNQTPVIVLTDTKSRDEFYAHVQAEVDAFEPDVSTDKGRKAIASLAYKIARTKTAIDAAGKELNDEARQRINAVDAERRAVREHFDALAKQVRQPLTEWEEAEEKRAEFIDNMIAMFRSARIVEMGETSASIRERGGEIFQIALDPDVFQDRLAAAQAEKDETVEILRGALDRAVAAEKEAEELARLRAENEEKPRKPPSASATKNAASTKPHWPLNANAPKRPKPKHRQSATASPPTRRSARPVKPTRSTASRS